MIGEQIQIDEWENIDGCHRKANGNLHYFINGLDQGVAASRLPSQAKKTTSDVLTWSIFDVVTFVLVRCGEWWICTG